MFFFSFFTKIRANDVRFYVDVVNNVCTLKIKLKRDFFVGLISYLYKV